VLVLRPVELVLDGAHGHELLCAVLLAETGSSLNVAVFVTGVCEIVMGEVDNIGGTLESELKVSGGLHLLLLDGDAMCGDSALEAVDGLAEGAEVEKTDLLIVLAGQLREDAAGDCRGTIDNY